MIPVNAAWVTSLVALMVTYCEPAAMLPSFSGPVVFRVNSPPVAVTAMPFVPPLITFAASSVMAPPAARAQIAAVVERSHFVDCQGIRVVRRLRHGASRRRQFPAA